MATKTRVERGWNEILTRIVEYDSREEFNKASDNVSEWHPLLIDISYLDMTITWEIPADEDDPLDAEPWTSW